MNRRTLFWIIGVAVIVAVIGAVLTKVTHSQGDKLEIGAVLLLSGDNALWGKNAQKAIELIADNINEDGGINGKDIKVLYADSKGQPQSAVAAFRKLVSLNEVPVVLGDMVSSTTLAMAPLANQSETVLIGISASAPAVTEAGPYVYRVWPSDLYEGAIFAEYIYNQGIDEVALVYLNNDYGMGLKNAFKSRFINLGGRGFVEEGYNPSDRNFRLIATKVKSAQPQAVYIVGYYEDTARVVTDLRQAGVDAELLGTSSSIHEKFFDIAGSAAEGFTAAVVNDYDQAALTPEQQAFAEEFKARYGMEPDWAATHGADAVMVVVECLRQDYTTGEGIKKCIDSQRVFEGINLNVTFDEKGDVVNKPIAVKKAQNGSFVTVWKQKQDVHSGERK